MQLTVSAAQLASSGAAGHTIGVEFFVSTQTNNQAANFDADPPAAVPEPVSLVLLGTVLALLALVARRKSLRAN